MYIFGGWDGVATLNDLFAFDFETGEWEEIETHGDVKGRYRHVSVANRTSMFVFGGIDQFQERFNDISEFNFETGTWSRVITIGSPPSARTFHQSVYYAGSIFIMGGFDGWKRNDMYKIMVDQSHAAPTDEEFKGGSSESDAGEVFTSEYFEQMPLL